LAFRFSFFDFAKKTDLHAPAQTSQRGPPLAPVLFRGAATSPAGIGTAAARPIDCLRTNGLSLTSLPILWKTVALKKFFSQDCLSGKTSLVEFFWGPATSGVPGLQKM
jgi:hypothetical protein